MKSILLSLLLACPLLCSAQDDVSRHRVSVDAGISTKDTYEVSGGYHYMFCRYAGIGAHAGIWSVFPDGGIFGETDEERSERENFFFKPSVLLVSPDVFSIRNCSFHFECEPALMVSTRQNLTGWCADGVPAEEYRTDCLSWHCDFSFGVRYRNVNFLAGYGISNLDVDREYKSSNRDKYSKKLINNIRLKVSVMF